MSTRHVRELTQASLQGLTAVCAVIEDWVQAGVGLDEVYLAALAPAACELGAQWAADDISFAQCSLAVSHLQHAIHRWHDAFVAPGHGGQRVGSVLLITEPQAQHSLGVVMLSEFFERAAWDVTLTLPADMESLMDTLHADWYDAILLSVSSDRHLADLSRNYGPSATQLANPDVRLFVGGPMAWVAPEQLQWPGVVVLQDTADHVVRRVTQATQHQGREPAAITHERMLAHF